MKIEFVDQAAPVVDGGVLAVLVFEGAEPSPASTGLDGELAAKLARLLARGAFRGRLGQSFSIATPSNLGADSVLILGAGPEAAWGARNAELAAAHAYNVAKAGGAEALSITLPAGGSDIAAHAGFGVRLATYRFDKYRTTAETKPKPGPTTVAIATDDPQSAASGYEALAGLADAIFIARDLVSEPANILFPAEFGRRVQALSGIGLEVEILGEADMRALGMGALLGVGQGSERESQLAVIQWRGSKDPTSAPVAFVGKGVCFDTGGISLKGADRMEEMIIDMAGAAAVTGAMYALAARKAKVNAVGILGLVENMPDGMAQRPGDIVTSMSGQTIEVINTDAEGRMVLADALWYCQDRFKPRFMVDLATLTGAIMTALGADVGGLFSNDEALATNLLAAAAASDDPLWRLPMPEQYAKSLESRAADMKHVGDRFGGAITAAQFIQKFVNKTPWAHLDVGMTVWKPKSNVATIPDGASGYGVRLLDRLVADYYEDAD